MKYRAVDCFGVSGRLLKTAHYGGYKKVLGKERPMVLTIYDAVNRSSESVMEYSNMRRVQLADRYFQKSYMERVSRWDV